MTATILLVDDEERLLRGLSRALESEGYDVVTQCDASLALDALSERLFDVLVIDYRMPELTGLDLVRQLNERLPRSERPVVVLMTAHATIENAIEAMQLGAFDYLQKPFEIEELLVVVQRALELRRLENAERYLLSERRSDFGDYGIVGASPAMRELSETIGRVAESKSTVLILGETGTGKELVARAIHDRSAQRELPLIKVNCAAIPESLLESELFGHARGAFTSATGARRGRFSLANHSSIFLDEIGTMGLPLQAKLLRVLQEREFEPLGTDRTQSVDVRVIAATNRNLHQMMEAGTFQPDLYYRLSVIPIELPPLRRRSADIPLLARHFVRKHADRIGRPIGAISPSAVAALESYSWPGNVRELENVIERAVVLSRSTTIDVEDISLSGGSSRAAGGLPSGRLHENVRWAERESIERALERASGVKKSAAESLGISQRALSHYLKKYDLG